MKLYNEWKGRKERQFDYSVIKLNITGTINEENDAVVNNDEVVEIKMREKNEFCQNKL